MGCSQSNEMPLKIAAAKRSLVLNLSMTETSCNSIPQKNNTSYKKLALRMLMRYANLIIFRTTYYCFRQWKHLRLSKLSLSEISFRNVSFTDDTFTLLIPQTIEKMFEDKFMLFSGDPLERIYLQPAFKPCINLFMVKEGKIKSKQGEKIKKFSFSCFLNEKVLVSPEELTKCSEVRGLSWLLKKNYVWVKHFLEEIIVSWSSRNKVFEFISFEFKVLNKAVVEPELITSYDSKIESNRLTSPNSPIMSNSDDSQASSLWSTSVFYIREKNITAPLSMFENTSSPKLQKENLSQFEYKFLSKSSSIEYKIISKPIIDNLSLFDYNLLEKAAENLSVFEYNILTKTRIPPESLKTEQKISICNSPTKPPKHPTLSSKFFESTPKSQKTPHKIPIRANSPRRIINFRPSTLEISETLIRSYKKQASVLSPLLTTLSTQNSSETPFSIPQTIKIFEELMDQKFALDQKELNDQIKPRELAEFFPDYLNRNFGIQKVGQKMLNRLLESLRSYSVHPYVNLFSRVLRIQCEDPISLNLLVYLCKARVDFNNLIQKKNDMLAKSGKNLQEKKYFKEMGGSATLLSIFSYVHNEFKDPEVIKRIIINICPQDLRFEEFCLFYLMSRVVKQGEKMTVFICEDIIKLLNDLIGTHLTDQQKAKLSTYIMNPENKVPQSSFNFRAFKEKIMLQKYWISKFEFLKGIIETYEYFKYKTLVFMAEVLQKYQKLTKKEFHEAVQEIDPSFTEVFINRIYLEAYEIDNNENISSTTFSTLMIQYAVGYLSYFRNFHLDLKPFNEAFKPRRVDYADLCIKPSDAFDLRSSITRSKTLSNL